MRNIPLPRSLRPSEIMVRVTYLGHPQMESVQIDLPMVAYKPQGPANMFDLAEKAWNTLQGGVHSDYDLNLYLGIRSCDIGDVIELHWEKDKITYLVVASMGCKVIDAATKDKIFAMPYMDARTYIMTLGI